MRNIYRFYCRIEMYNKVLVLEGLGFGRYLSVK